MRTQPLKPSDHVVEGRQSLPYAHEVVNLIVGELYGIASQAEDKRAAAGLQVPAMAQEKQAILILFDALSGSTMPPVRVTAH